SDWQFDVHKPVRLYMLSHSEGLFVCRSCRLAPFLSYATVRLPVIYFLIFLSQDIEYLFTNMHPNSFSRRQHLRFISI
ncbi:hypothetical protein L9F63_005480, partial [Diploptera punctata]